YASFIDPHTRKALDLLLDQYFFSTFPTKELEKEKSVVIDEIHLYQDSPDEQIFDVFEEKLFMGTSLGTNILGTEKSVSHFHSNMVASFHRQYFTAENSVLAYSGNWPLSKVIAAIEKYVDYMPTGTAPKRMPFQGATPFQLEEAKNCQQVYKNLGGLAFSASEPSRIPMLLLTAILGGDNANSRLNLNIREKVGLVYQIEAQYNPMTDVGLFNIFFSSDPKYAHKIEGLIDKELMKLCTKALSSGELHRFKTQFKSKVLMGEESRQGLIAALAKNILDFGRIDSLEEVFKAIDSITSADLLACANEQIHPDRLSRLTYYPES
ncbi:MAG: M16 family metallopeptidase, partial [Bacteroidia bacterium]